MKGSFPLLISLMCLEEAKVNKRVTTFEGYYSLKEFIQKKVITYLNREFFALKNKFLDTSSYELSLYLAKSPIFHFTEEFFTIFIIFYLIF